MMEVFRFVEALDMQFLQEEIRGKNSSWTINFCDYGSHFEF